MDTKLKELKQKITESENKKLLSFYKRLKFNI